MEIFHTKKGARNQTKGRTENDIAKTIKKKREIKGIYASTQILTCFAVEGRRAWARQCHA